MVVIVCGDRNWDSKEIVEMALFKLDPKTTVIHGGCRGADRIAGELAASFGYEVVVMKADWEFYGKAAGPIRNAEMLKKKPDFVIGFHDHILESKGTKNMLDLTVKAGLTFVLINSKGEIRKFIPPEGGGCPLGLKD